MNLSIPTIYSTTKPLSLSICRRFVADNGTEIEDTVAKVRVSGLLALILVVVVCCLFGLVVVVGG